MKDLIVIGLLSCCSKKDYMLQIEACKKTWCDNDFTYFITGEKCRGMCKDENIIHLPNVGDDVLSATDKQWLGLIWLYEKFPEKDFYYIAGTDTYARLDILLPWLNNYKKEEFLYIGGHDGELDILNAKINFHSGGSGFIL